MMCDTPQSSRKTLKPVKSVGIIWICSRISLTLSGYRHSRRSVRNVADRPSLFAIVAAIFHFRQQNKKSHACRQGRRRIFQKEFSQGNRLYLFYLFVFIIILLCNACQCLQDCAKAARISPRLLLHNYRLLSFCRSLAHSVRLIRFIPRQSQEDR